MSQDEIDHPFPLRRQFRVRFLPLFVILLVTVSAAAGFGAASIVEMIYLDFAARQADVIDRAVSRELPGQWRALAASTNPQAVLETPAGTRLSQYLAAEADELGLSHLKIYSATGITLFSLEPSQIGKLEANQLFHEALEGNRGVALKSLADSHDVYEIYTPLASKGAGVILIFELYEPVVGLNKALLMAAIPSGLSFFGLLAMIALGLARLVDRAQADIDHRTSLLIEFRTRLERFVSGSAVRAARNAVSTQIVESRRFECTIFYSDIRSFTSFSEQNDPADVVAFLNEIFEIQIAAIDKNGGDVDKLIGDAVLARFDGNGKERRALLAAQSIQREIVAKGLKRGLGIGVFTGPVVIGPVGPNTRMDFTVIGDSVNIAARLCSAADEKEIVCDLATLETARLAKFDDHERLTVKGRTAPITVSRWVADDS